MIKHGMTESAEYRSWGKMKERCYAPSSPRYRTYGGRGITVCERWRTSFENFYADLGPKPSPEHWLDRIDNDGNYEPENCRWSTRKEQMRNTTVSKRLTYKGETLCIAGWAERLGMNIGTLSSRLQHGWTLERALTATREPRFGGGKQLTFSTIGGDVVTAAQRGKHYIEPRGYAAPPGTGPEGETCSTCKHREGGRQYSKCGLTRQCWTHSRRTDILARAAACRHWEAK